jgi:hypothetical protein
MPGCLVQAENPREPGGRRTEDQIEETMMTQSSDDGGGHSTKGRGGHQMKERRTKLEILDHPLAAEIQPDLAKHRDSVVLTGYQKKTDSDMIRIYHGLDFKSYYEIPRDDIIHHWMSDPDDKNSPTMFSIKAESTPHLVIPSIPSAAAGYLRGGIVSSFLANAIQQAGVPEINSPGKPPCHVTTNDNPIYTQQNCQAPVG